MVVFTGSNNQLMSFPIQPKMEYFNGDNNHLISFPIQPNMKEFYGDNNKSHHFLKKKYCFTILNE